MNTKSISTKDQIIRGLLHLSGAAALLVAPACVVEPGDDEDPDQVGDTGDAPGDTGAPSDSGQDTGEGEGEGDEGDDGQVPDPDGCEEVAATASDILDQYCAGCHLANVNSGNFGFVDNPEQMIAAGLITPGDAEGSLLFQRVSNGSMPPAGDDVTPAEQDILGEWINECLGSQGQNCDGQPVITFEEQLEYMLTDISTVDFDDRPFTRYITFADLYSAGYCVEEIDQYAAGMSKAINSMSWDPVIHTPVAVDPNRTIYRIDLRDYDWSEDDPGNPDGVDKWEVLTNNGSAYAFTSVDEEAIVLQQFTEDDRPFINGMAFIHDTMNQNDPNLAFFDDDGQQGLYQLMMGNFANLAALEGFLGVDRAASEANGDAFRAGFLESGVSDQQRAFQGEPLKFGQGFYWISFDFLDNNVAEKDLFQTPIGFAFDGGEIIFNLPNGLQAYYIFDNAGNFLNRVPNQVAQDPNSFTNEVVNAASCVDCHNQQGVQPATDDIRAYVEQNFLLFDEDTREAVEELYLEPSVFAQLLDQGGSIFQSAQTTSYMGIQVELEPTSQAFKKFNAGVTREELAGILGISEDLLLANLGRLDPSFQTLINPNARVSRRLVDTQIANIICVLNVGIADDEACGIVDEEEEVDSGE